MKTLFAKPGEALPTPFAGGSCARSKQTPGLLGCYGTTCDASPAPQSFTFPLPKAVPFGVLLAQKQLLRCSFAFRLHMPKAASMEFNLQAQSALMPSLEQKQLVA
eukprot:394525-Prorocentrum_lima.AAC.1